MSTTTQNLGLTLPSEDEQYSVGVVNNNNVLIDLAVGGLLGNSSEWFAVGSVIQPNPGTLIVQYSSIKTTSVIEVIYAEASKSIVAAADVYYTIAAGSLVIAFRNTLSEAVTLVGIRISNP